MCCRFVLSNPHVDVCLTAVRQGPLAEEEMEFMREFGEAVYRRYKYFM